MEIVRYVDRVEGAIRVGVRSGAEVMPVPVRDLADLWTRTLGELPELLGAPGGESRPADEVLFLPPVDGRTEVWAAGVTYERSRSARQEESSMAGVYELVYEAARPELFFKSAAWRVVTNDEPIGVRGDSDINVPEAELGLAVNAHAEIVGYLVCNDMSSRSIEGENPLYLPQAKMYAGSCALGTGIRPAWEVPTPGALRIELVVTREGETEWRADTTTASLRRPPDELVQWLFAEQAFPDGVILSTGTGLVPDLDFSLRPGDEVRITIDGVGTLTNPVIAGRDQYPWLELTVTELLATGRTRRSPDP
jgi:2-dehydro-3-deoxy-D-arabinonate dehydratase